ncbi:MAG: TIGR00266 family protein [Clostridia bacterium]|nr:TIGR00266 family protein [Clostridia bacterium]
MQYEIKGAPMPVVECVLEQGESIKCEGGSMSWMTANMKMQTNGGGIGKMFSKALSGEKLFQNTYTAEGGRGLIAFASTFPGNIIAVEIAPGKDLICQKSAYLASTTGVELSIFFHRKLGAGFFGGEGFIMQRLSGSGIAFLELDGSVETKMLQAGEQIIVDTGYLAMMDATCSMDIKSVGGVKNMLVGGEGLFNTVVTGPGKVVLQTMPASKLLGQIAMNTSK